VPFAGTRLARWTLRSAFWDKEKKRLRALSHTTPPFAWHGCVRLQSTRALWSPTILLPHCPLVSPLEMVCIAIVIFFSFQHYFSPEGILPAYMKGSPLAEWLGLLGMAQWVQSQSYLAPHHCTFVSLKLQCVLAHASPKLLFIHLKSKSRALYHIRVQFFFFLSKLIRGQLHIAREQQPSSEQHFSMRWLNKLLAQQTYI